MKAPHASVFLSALTTRFRRKHVKRSSKIALRERMRFSSFMGRGANPVDKSLHPGASSRANWFFQVDIVDDLRDRDERRLF